MISEKLGSVSRFLTMIENLASFKSSHHISQSPTLDPSQEKSGEVKKKVRRHDDVTIGRRIADPVALTAS